MGASDATEGIGVVLGVDHVIFRECLRDWIGRTHGITVVGEARSPADVLQMAADVRPDVLVLSASSDRSSAELYVVRELRRQLPDMKIVVLSLRHDAAVEELLDHGAHWCLQATSTRADLVLALRNVVHMGDDPPPRRRQPQRQEGDEPEGRPHWPACLSPREEEVLELVSLALSNAQIGARLSITEGTVKRHLRNIYGKLGAVSRIDAVNKAARLSLLRTFPGKAHCLGVR
ncbi:response regulator transcription factor [Nonomuraea sp. SYSU D8015]|uniref:response regulator transcription factor n=1 Tax=Nonomuraea sp. SYSU D8015 TaxID=2593644 RepID=UPI001660C28F|nr:response regulator transcription factor [Nonomuraea sp. SYSU D8015]